jgi:protein-S-isoprenylcysteine O-methyltransferase Ste14
MHPQNAGGEARVQALLAKGLDWPPVWTLGGLVAIWLLALIPMPFGFGTYGPGLALACLIFGLGLMGKAVFRMRAHGTTVIPHRVPQALVTDGVFALSRNPIYLGDALVLFAATFWTNSPTGLVVLAGFVWVITNRFIKPEEERLAAAFGDRAAEWFTRVRRWI